MSDLSLLEFAKLFVRGTVSGLSFFLLASFWNTTRDKWGLQDKDPSTQRREHYALFAFAVALVLDGALNDY